MLYPLTRSMSYGAICALACAALASAGHTLAAGTFEDDRHEALPSSSSTVLFEDLEAPLRPHNYPGLPSADPLEQDPERIRETLHLDVQRALAEAPELADASILVRVSSLRRVRLTGVVKSDSARILAEVIAAAVAGISGVDNRLRIEAVPQ